MVEVLGITVDTLDIVREKLASEVSVPQSVVAQLLHLSRHDIQGPVFFARCKHVDAQSRCYNASIGILAPVDGEGKELFATEIHHGKQLVHQSPSEPSLCILAHAAVSIPAIAAVSGQVVEFADGCTTQFDVRL